jgi:hypothetical protein
MKNAIALLTIVAALANPLYADSWPRPIEKDYFSPNRRYVAHVTPAKADSSPTLEMSQIKDAERIALWQCVLCNEGAPQNVLLTDDGRYVATVNENNDRAHGGMGPCVLAFYNREGLIKNYSLEQIFHYTGPPNTLSWSEEFRHLIGRSVSGRSWASMPMFFDADDAGLYFCLWLSRGRYFLAWDPTTGDQVKITDDLKNRWNTKGREWALTQGVKSRSYYIAVEFLLSLKRPEDRAVIESLLTEQATFYTQPVQDWSTKDRRFVRLYARSPKRDIAERALARWDQKPAENADRSQIYYYLGTVSGTIQLPEAPGPDKSRLCLYLIPGDTIPDDWHKSVPVHRLTEYFWEYSYHNAQWPPADIPFSIQGVTPGTYTLKAVWDKAAPHTFGDDYIKGPPQQGDYESTAAPTITVEPGKTVGNIQLDCTHALAGPPD